MYGGRALRAAGASGETRLPTHGGERRRRGRDLPAVGRAAAGDRAGSGPYQVALSRRLLALFKELGDETGVALALSHLGYAAAHGGDAERVTALREEAESQRRKSIDPRIKAYLLVFLALAALGEGDHERVVALLEEAMGYFRRLEDLLGINMCLTALGMTALKRSDNERARTLFVEDLRLLRKLGDRLGVAYCLLGLAAVAASRGQPARAARLWGAAEALREADGLSLSPFDRAHYGYDGRVAATRAQLGETEFAAAWAEGREMGPERAVEYTLEWPAIPEVTVTRSYPEGLSARGVEVLRLVAKGLTNAQIVNKLFISPRTVNRHLNSVYRKLGFIPRRRNTLRLRAQPPLEQ